MVWSRGRLRVKDGWIRGVSVGFLVAAAALAVGCGGATVSGAGHGNVLGDGTTEESGSRPRPLDVRIEEIAGERSEARRGLAADEARLVAADVAARRAAQHEALPEMQRTGSPQNDAWPVVTVRNATPHGLVVWFAGPCARTVALTAQETKEVEICEGGYEIAAQLASDDFVPFVGEGDEVENGYRYSLTFYVLVEPTTTTRTVNRQRTRTR